MSATHSGVQYRVITLRGLYNEAKNKYNLFPGDLIIISGAYPWAVDLPIFYTSPGSRMLSWLIWKTEIAKSMGSIPLKSPFPKRVPYFHELMNAKEVKDRFEFDYSAAKNCTGTLQKSFPENNGCPPHNQISVQYTE